MDLLQQANQLSAYLKPHIVRQAHQPQPEWPRIARALDNAPAWASPLAPALVLSMNTPLPAQLVQTPPSQASRPQLDAWALQLEAACGIQPPLGHICVGIWLQVGLHIAHPGTGSAAPPTPPCRARWWGPLANQLNHQPGQKAHRLWFFRLFFSYAMLFAVFVSALMGFLFGFMAGATFGYFTRLDMLGCIYVFSALFTLIAIVVGLSAFRADLRQLNH